MKYRTLIAGLLLLPFAFSIAPVESQPSAVPVNVRVIFNRVRVTGNVDPRLPKYRAAEIYGKFRVFRDWQRTPRVQAGVGQDFNPGWVLEEYVQSAPLNQYLTSYIEVFDKDRRRDDRLLSSWVRVDIQRCQCEIPDNKAIHSGIWQGNTCVIRLRELNGKDANVGVTLSITRI